MGYELHITRKEHWSDEGVDISQAGWEMLIETDPEMKITGKAIAKLPDGELTYENPLLAEWHGHSEKEVVWFDFRNGQVIVKGIDDQILEKMLFIAMKLNAHIQGDDGEFYPSLEPKKPWWKFWE